MLYTWWDATLLVPMQNRQAVPVKGTETLISQAAYCQSHTQTGAAYAGGHDKGCL